MVRKQAPSTHLPLRSPRAVGPLTLRIDDIDTFKTKHEDGLPPWQWNTKTFSQTGIDSFLAVGLLG